mmetsp:Transcript_55060/g.101925  ORF Transcript_55060/g.101925 Transcript_55060/m.101925 type:complete len:369 (-) Transcript_55060:199-1305(-)
MQHNFLVCCLAWAMSLVPSSGILLSKPWQNVSTGGAAAPLLLPAKMTDEDIKSAMKRYPWDPLLVWGSEALQSKDGAVNAVKHSDQFPDREHWGHAVSNQSFDVQHGEAQMDQANAREERDRLMCKLKADFPSGEVRGHIPHYGTCAVVSNSGVLDLHSHGRNIDTADAVFRFNLAPAGQKYYDTVGKKETIRLINDRAAQESLTKMPADVSFDTVEQAVIVPFAEPTLEVLKDIQSFQEQHEHVRLLLLEQRTLEEGEQLLKAIYDTHWFHDGVSFKPTSGFVGMLFALSVCDTVHAYGMAATPRSDYSAYHYYKSGKEHGKKEADENGWHKTFPAEKDLWRRLAVNKESLDQSDWVEMPGFSEVSC